MTAARAWLDRDELLARVDLEALLDSLTERDPRRRAWRCPDLDHPDVHPSVTITTDRRGTQRWRCWSGGHGGTAIDAVMAARHVNAGDAMQWLNENHAHLDVIDRPHPPPRRPIGSPAPEVIEYVERAERLLWSDAGSAIREWLFRRGLNEPVLRANRVGADPGRRHLPRAKGLPIGWPAAVFPALSPDDRITYCQARIVDPKPGRGKYDNPIAELATNPRLAWTTVPPGADQTRLMIVEGIPDALTAAQHGHQAVAVLGATASSDETIDALVAEAMRRHANSIRLCVDGDAAGEVLRQQLARGLVERGLAVDHLRPPSGRDLTSWVQHASSSRPFVSVRTPTVGLTR